MKIKNNLRTAFQLLGLLCLLFWSFTWNIPNDIDLTRPKKSFKKAFENCLKDASEEKGSKRYPAFAESFKSGKYVGTNPGSLLPPFNVWKEVELRKQEVNVRDRVPVPKVPRRKLNYASAKCGAKILASNKESKHRLSILNEKVDEYMLNPCGLKVWFVVELCDTIEVSQIELANYELYSSVPKDFSVFWSNVYPTQTWHHLGTFQAKNLRTMQTFSIDSQSLGKFIKVIISSHHGREHFCPLSVLRIVGYSMVYEYEAIEEQNEQNKNKNESKMNGAESTTPQDTLNSAKTYSSIKGIKLHTKTDSNSKVPAFPAKVCQLIQKRCSTSQPANASWNQPMCLFLQTVIFKDLSSCSISTKEKSTRNFLLTSDSIVKSRNFKANERSESYSIYDALKKDTHNQGKVKTQNLNDSISTLDKNLTDFPVEKLGRPIDRHHSDARTSDISIASNTTGDLLDKNERASQTDGKGSENTRVTAVEIETLNSNSQCDCAKVSQAAQKISPKQNFSFEASLFEQNVADSAALIQKESVLVKMNVRIKTLETNLSLINRYLQQLSESYRMQVEDMLNMFDGTVKAITMTSAKAAIADKQQQLIIDQLDRKINILSMKIQHLGSGQKGTLKQVLELHGFFLILEIIIMSTIFSVFFNKFKRDVLV